MPVMNGLEAGKVLRERFGKQVKIFMLTGNVTMNRDNKQLFELMDGVLTKPSTRKQLEECLRTLK